MTVYVTLFYLILFEQACECFPTPRSALLYETKCFVFPWRCWKDEHGAWNIPRDLIKGILHDALYSKGLDTNKQFYNGSTAAEFKKHVMLMVPGTKWCGPGNSAKNDSELGLFKKVDVCCRAHDQYPIYIKPGETKYGLTNTGIFKRSECKSDYKFRRCLKKQLLNPIAISVGYTYFSVLRPQCFKKNYPIRICLLYLNFKCFLKIRNRKEPLIYQWHNNKTF